MHKNIKDLVASINAGNHVMIRAEKFNKETVPSFLRFANNVSTGSAMVQAAAKEGDGTKRIRKFSMNAYNGGAMNVGFGVPVVLDLAGMTFQMEQLPVLLQHDTLKPVGHATNVIIGAKQVDVDGEFSHVNEHSEEIITSSDNGAIWQSSVGANIEKVVFFEEGESGEANGQIFDGPVLIARKSQLKENSFVVLGADDSTRTSIAASDTQHTEIGVFMKTFEEWLIANSHDIKKMSETELKFARGSYDLEKKLEAASKPSAPAPAVVTGTSAEVKAAEEKAARTAVIVQSAKVELACKNHPEILEAALNGDWDLDRTKDAVALKEMRAEREVNTHQFGANVNAGQNTDMDTAEIEIALLQAGGYKEENLLKHFSEKQLEASHAKYKANLGMQELMVDAARFNGHSGRQVYKGNEHDIFAHATATGPMLFLRGQQPMKVEAGTRFGTLSLPGILGNVANKFFREGFMFVDQSWDMVSAKGSVTDFKKRTTYSLTGDMTFEKVGPGGEIRSGSLGELSYENQAQTYAKMFGITRQDLINDDLDALSTAPRRLGRGAGLAFNDVFWTEFNDNAAFFTAGRGNLLTGQAFDLTELERMDKALDEQVDPNNKPMNSDQGRILLTGPAHKIKARQYFRDTTLIGTTTENKPISANNPFVGDFTPVNSTYPANTTLGGLATVAYLLANPEENPVIESVFLNGVRQPTIETADARFDLLGIDMRGWFDFGVEKQEYRGGVRSNGA